MFLNTSMEAKGISLSDPETDTLVFFIRYTSNYKTKKFWALESLGIDGAPTVIDTFRSREAAEYRAFSDFLESKTHA